MIISPSAKWSCAARLGSQPMFVGRTAPAIMKLARFAGVGLASSILYAMAVLATTSGLRIHPDASAVLGYTITMPFNFWAHRYFTFGSTSRIGGDAARYVATQTLAVLVSAASMAICVDGFRLPYVCGIAATIVLVPPSTYLILDRWAFGKARS